MFETIILKSIDPSRNRNRAYAITITCSANNENIYILRQSWGRGDHHKNEKVTYFQEMDEVLAYAATLLLRRKQHGYQVVSLSEKFPERCIPRDIKYGRYSLQLSIFSIAWAA
ncbi:MAG: WGR domain-containing protein [Saprospiraceae bacterium]|nr:WGR domain-containing protein [Saprospiraceae bacterium]